MGKRWKQCWTIGFRPLRLLCVADLSQESESPADLPDEAIVVRGGEMAPEPTIKSAEATFREVGVYGLSVWSAAELSAGDIVRLARSHDTERQRYLPHGKMRTSTVGQLRGHGFELVPDSPLGHYLLTIPTPPADDDWNVLQQEFGNTKPTPSKQEV